MQRKQSNAIFHRQTPERKPVKIDDTFLSISKVLFFSMLAFYFVLHLEYHQNKILLKTTDFRPYTINNADFFDLYLSIPPFYDGYEIKHVHEVLDSTERAKRHMVLKRNVKYLKRFRETSRTFVLDTDYLKINNVLVNGLCIFGRNDSLISLKGVDNPRPEYPIHVLREADSVIALTHFPISFSSPFYNIYFSILIIPMDVIKRSNLIIPATNKNATREIYNIVFGFKDIIELKPNEYVLARELHTVINPTPGITHYATAAHNFSVLYRTKFNLTEIKPTDYALVNREPRYARHIKNFDEVCNAFREKLPQYDWKIVPDIFSTMLEAARTWAKFVVVMTTTGSNLVRCIAMAPNTAILCIFGNRYDWEVIALTQVFDLFIYILPIPNMLHFNPTTKNILDPELAVHVMRETIYATQHGRWSNETLQENAGYARKYKEYPN